MAPTSIIIITGANGALGSATALEICKAYPGKYHLVLTARNISDASALAATASLRQLSPAPSFSWSTVELAQLENIKLFTAEIKRRIAAGEIPTLRAGGIINSAAVFSFVTGSEGRTRDGFDVNYGVNVLAPMLLVVELLEEPEGGGMVVNMASVSHIHGVVDYFHLPRRADERDKDDEKGGKTLGVTEAFKRYGSSKLLLAMAGYALQRRIDTHKIPSNIQIVALDPGVMSGPSHMVAGGHWLFKILQAILTFLGPLLRMADKSAINAPAVPARMIAGLFTKAEGTSLAGKYFVLDDEVQSSVASLDVAEQERVWRRAMAELKLDADL